MTSHSTSKIRPKFKSDAFAAIHSAAEGLHRAGTIDADKMRQFDASCLVMPREIDPQHIKAIREKIMLLKPFSRCI